MAEGRCMWHCLKINYSVFIVMKECVTSVAHLCVWSRFSTTVQLCGSEKSAVSGFGLTVNT